MAATSFLSPGLVRLPKRPILLPLASLAPDEVKLAPGKTYYVEHPNWKRHAVMYAEEMRKLGIPLYLSSYGKANHSFPYDEFCGLVGAGSDLEPPFAQPFVLSALH